MREGQKLERTEFLYRGNKIISFVLCETFKQDQKESELREGLKS